MTSDFPAFRRLTPIERAFDRAFGFLLRLGFGLPHNYLPEVRGRKTGRTHATPVAVFAFWFLKQETRPEVRPAAAAEEAAG